LKKIGILAVATVAALVFGATMFGGTQNANAEVTEVVDVHCALIVSGIDGDLTNDLVAADLAAGCAGVGVTPGDPTNPAVQPYTWVSFARLIGDEDSTLEASDFDEFEGWDANQLSTSCTFAGGGTLGPIPCANVIFAFVNDEKPVTLDTPSGLTSIEAGGLETDFICDDNTEDADCDDSPASDGDGVVVFHVLNFSADRGDEKTVNVDQEAVVDSVDINMVGIPDDIEIVLAEDTIGSNGSVAASNTCTTTVDVTEAVDAPNATVAIVTLEDEDNRLLTMWPLLIAVSPASEDPSIAQLGIGDPVEDVTGDTILTLKSGDLDPAYYRTVCGGSGTGETVIAVESITDGSTAEAELTVVGLPADIALTAVPAEIECDGSETSTVSALVTDSAGNNVANGTEVNFSVVALGTANPINTTTTDGVATTVVTPLSNSSAGVTVIVTAGDVQNSIRVDCALPLDTQPTLAPPPPQPISPPDTGNGGYLAQDGSSFPMWTLIALALGALAMVGTGVVARNAAK
jgi:hypothetical protein